VYDLQSSRVLVETSMLAAVTALSQFMLGLLRLEGYMYYILPFPLVLASVRSGPAAGRKTLMATFFLMLGEKQRCRCEVCVRSAYGSSSSGCICHTLRIRGHHFRAFVAWTASLDCDYSVVHHCHDLELILVHCSRVLRPQRECV